MCTCSCSLRGVRYSCTQFHSPSSAQFSQFILCVQVLEDHSRPVLSLAIADNKLFSGSYDYTIKVWSLDTLQRLKTLTGQPPTHPLCARAPVLGRIHSEAALSMAWVTAPMKELGLLRMHGLA